MTNPHDHDWTVTTLEEGRIVRLLCQCGFSLGDCIGTRMPNECDQRRPVPVRSNESPRTEDDTFPATRGFGRVCWSCGTTLMTTTV